MKNPALSRVGIIFAIFISFRGEIKFFSNAQQIGNAYSITAVYHMRLWVPIRYEYAHERICLYIVDME